MLTVRPELVAATKEFVKSTFESVHLLEEYGGKKSVIHL
jgi:hypothetical protein